VERVISPATRGDCRAQSACCPIRQP
jgi:hypothetical protein